MKSGMVSLVSINVNPALLVFDGLSVFGLENVNIRTSYNTKFHEIPSIHVCGLGLKKN